VRWLLWSYLLCMAFFAVGVWRRSVNWTLGQTLLNVFTVAVWPVTCLVGLVLWRRDGRRG